jgi:hypothetical protein
MSYSQKYCLVSFSHPVEVGAEFKMTDWPLHITLADIFAVNLNSELVKSLEGLLITQPPVAVVAGKEATLGEAKVVLLNKNESLINLHIKLIDLLTSHGAVFNSPGYTKDGFLPHCTIQKDQRLHDEDKLTIDTVSLVDMFPDGNWQQRKVVHVFNVRKFDSDPIDSAAVSQHNR